MKTPLFILIFILASVALTPARHAYALSSSEAELLAANLLARDLSHWLTTMEHKPSNVAIFSVRFSDPLTEEYASLVESEIIREIKRENTITISTCLECRTPQVSISGEHLVVTKGAPDAEAMRTLARKNGAKAFLFLSMFRSPFSVVAEAMLYSTESGELVAVEQFRVPAFELANASLLLMLQGGPGKLIGPHQPNDENDIPFTLNLLALEELGFGKGGLTLGGIFGGAAGNLGYILPTIGLRGRFGATPVSSLASLGAGFAFNGPQAGLGLRVSYDVFIGTFTVVGLNANYLVPINSLLDSTESGLRGFIGLHLGISIGR